MTILNLGHRGRGGGYDIPVVDVERAIVLAGHRGSDWYVNSNLSASGNGATWGGSVLTIDEAVGLANADDRIHVAPTHVETVTAAAGLDLDKAGLTLIGYGNGNRRPQINFTTAVGADMDVDAAGITMVNFRFTGGIDALTGPIDVNAADFTMLDCITEDVTGQTTDFIVTDANADRLLIDGWIHRGAAGDGADSAISIVGGDDIVIKNFQIYGNFDQGAIENVTTAAVRIHIHDGRIWTAASEDLAVVLHASATGVVGPNIYAVLADNAANITEAFVGAAAYFMQPIALVNAAGESSMQTNITATVDEA